MSIVNIPTETFLQLLEVGNLQVAGGLAIRRVNRHCFSISELRRFWVILLQNSSQTDRPLPLPWFRALESLSLPQLKELSFRYCRTSANLASSQPVNQSYEIIRRPEHSVTPGSFIFLPGGQHGLILGTNKIELWDLGSPPDPSSDTSDAPLTTGTLLSVHRLPSALETMVTSQFCIGRRSQSALVLVIPVLSDPLPRVDVLLCEPQAEGDPPSIHFDFSVPLQSEYLPTAMVAEHGVVIVTIVQGNGTTIMSIVDLQSRTWNTVDIEGLESFKGLPEAHLARNGDLVFYGIEDESMEVVVFFEVMRNVGQESGRTGPLSPNARTTLPFLGSSTLRIPPPSDTSLWISNHTIATPQAGRIPFMASLGYPDDYTVNIISGWLDVDGLVRQLRTNGATDADAVISRSLCAHCAHSDWLWLGNHHRHIVAIPKTYGRNVSFAALRFASPSLVRIPVPTEGVYCKDWAQLHDFSKRLDVPQIEASGECIAFSDDAGIMAVAGLSEEDPGSIVLFRF